MDEPEDYNGTVSSPSSRKLRAGSLFFELSKQLKSELHKASAERHDQIFQDLTDQPAQNIEEGDNNNGTSNDDARSAMIAPREPSEQDILREVCVHPDVPTCDWYSFRCT